ncbi:MAG TPA: PEP-CTERM sorting domain-containing protein [Planctomycetes bacterium]|nr:PEP-CTERM sorting domain-containing protein [Planctomycetota bacterium]
MLMIPGLVAWALFSLATPGSVGMLAVRSPSEPDPSIQLISIQSKRSDTTSGPKLSGSTKAGNPKSPSGSPAQGTASARVIPASKKDGDSPSSPRGNPVPEPGTLALLGSGLLALAFYRRRGSEQSS